MPYVVVTGVPGAGKTTVGRALAAELNVPLLDKDDFLDALLDRSSQPAARRSELSRLADTTFVEQAKLKSAAVLVSFWRRLELSSTSGTPTEWLRQIPGPIELWCRFDPEIALRRFRARSRHPGHGDDRRTSAELRMQFAALALLGPLGVGRLVSVDSGDEVDVRQLALLVRDPDHDERRIP